MDHVEAAPVPHASPPSAGKQTMMKFPFPFYDTFQTLKRLGLASQDVLMGLHSGIPPCCVAYFCGHVLLEPENMKDFGRRKKKEYGISVGYVPCPTCALEIRLGILEPSKVHCCSPNDWKCRLVFKLAGLLDVLEKRIPRESRPPNVVPLEHPKKPEDS